MTNLSQIKWEQRFVKEEHIIIDEYQMNGCDSFFQFVLRELIPNYDNYVKQYNSGNGDKSECATNFLFHILPYLVHVVIQNGIYFVKDFPEHHFSKLLLVSLNNM